MHEYDMIVPNFERETRTHFFQWLDRLQHSGICTEIYRNSTVDTAELLEKAHGKDSVFRVNVLYTGTYLIGAEERTEARMNDIEERIQQQYERHLVLIETHDDFRYEE